MKTKKKLFLNQKGQSLIEFVLFLPFIMMMYSVIINVANSINASLNQQKVTRAYFYYNLQNNSTFPKPRRDVTDPSDSWGTFGMQIIGWAVERNSDGEPVMPCFKFTLPIGDGAEDECKEAYNGRATQHVRVGTVYGACGATYVRNNRGKYVYRLGGETLKLKLQLRAVFCLTRTFLPDTFKNSLSL